MIEFRAPSRDELALLSALCLRSKSVWGYDDVFLEACRDELTLTPADLSRTRVLVAVANDSHAGVVQVACDGDIASLEKLFVAPERIGTGIGRRLFAWARRKASAAGARGMIIDADPGAVGFYKRMGARKIGQAPSGSIAGRTLPRLIVDIDHSPVGGSNSA